MGAIQTEAMRLAKNLVKEHLREKSIPICTVPASEITQVAKLLIKEMPEILEQAEYNLKSVGYKTLVAR